jgi:hypothetical protein
MNVGKIFVVGFMSPSAICLIYAWWAYVNSRKGPIEPRWRAALLKIGLVLASLSQVLATSFLVQGFRSDAQSFAEPVSRPWAIANTTTLASWVLALVTVALGNGRVRRPLLVWGLVFPVACWVVIMMGYDY